MFQTNIFKFIIENISLVKLYPPAFKVEGNVFEPQLIFNDIFGNMFHGKILGICWVKRRNNDFKLLAGGGCH